jgi:hypothetical protein
MNHAHFTRRQPFTRGATMFSIRSLYRGIPFLSFIIFSAFSADPKPAAPSSDSLYSRWVPVDEADWAVYMEAPEYHFDLAREYLQKGEYAKAAYELSRGKSFLVFQKNRLSAALRQIDELSGGLSTGKGKNLDRFDTVTSTALKVINHKYAMVPVEIDATALLEEGHNYHYEKAKLRMQDNERSKTTAEIRKTASYLKLQATTMGRTAGARLDLAANELKKLASRIESGAVINVKELESIFNNTTSTVPKKKE